MSKGLRASSRKVNNKKLKARVFGPVESARTERLSNKLLELASQPKPPRTDMDVETTDDSKPTESEAKETSNADDTVMEVDPTNLPRTSAYKAEKRAKENKVARIAKKRQRKTHNEIAFKKGRVNKKSTKKSY